MDRDRNVIMAHSDIPWKQIIALRNNVVHGYGKLKTSLLWATVTEDIPELRRKCEAIIAPPPESHAEKNENEQ